MKNKTLLVIILVLSTVFVFGQNQKQAMNLLKKINKTEQVDKYKKKYPDWQIRKVETMGIDSVNFPKAVNSQIGEIYSNQYDDGRINVLFKVLKRRKVEICKVQYIYFDGSKMGKNEIDSIRTKILNLYETGTDFTKLANEYTMDGNPTGDLQWFYNGIMVKEFEDAAMPRKKGEIFTVDVESRKWYYVVLKTHNNKITTLTELVGIQYAK